MGQYIGGPVVAAVGVVATVDTRAIECALVEAPIWGVLDVCAEGPNSFIEECLTWRPVVFGAWPTCPPVLGPWPTCPPVLGPWPPCPTKLGAWPPCPMAACACCRAAIEEDIPLADLMERTDCAGVPARPDAGAECSKIASAHVSIIDVCIHPGAPSLAPIPTPAPE